MGQTVPIIRETPPPGLSPEEEESYLESLIELAEKAEKKIAEERSVSLRLETTKPIAVAFTGDWHCGQVGVRYRALRRDNALLAETPGVYCVGMGDYIQNAKARSKPGSSMYRAAFPDVDDQKRFALHELRKLRGRWLALTSGCHLEWDYEQAGIRSLRDLVEDVEAKANLGPGGVIRLTVGEVDYTILARHRFRGDSPKHDIFSGFHKAYEECLEERRLDVIAFAHFHFNQVAQLQKGPREVTFLRSGSYYENDEYANLLGGYRGEVGVPVVILFPDRRRVLAFGGEHLTEAIHTLKRLRGEQINS